MFLISVTALLPVLALAGWMRTYGTEEYFEKGRCVRQTTDGGYVIIASWASDLTESYDIWLIKTDPLGDTLWTKTYSEGGTGWDEGHCVQQTSDGGYIISGFTNCEIMGVWVGDVWLIKTDSMGDTMWTRIYRGAHLKRKNWVEQTSDGGYILTSNWNGAYLLLLKTDEDGNTEWSKNYQWGDVQEIGYCVRQTTDGGYIVATSLGLLKTNENGDSLWLNSFPSGCVDQTLDGGYIQATSHYADIWLIKTDTLGDTVWTRTYGGNDEDYSYDVQQTTDGGYIIVGITRSFGAGFWDTWLLKTDSLGDTVWTRIFGGEQADEGYSVQQTLDGGYVITGLTGSDSPYGFSDVWLIKTDSLGYVGVEEPPVQVESDWQVISSIGPQITLRYTDHPQGFSASIFDATGRKVDEVLHALLLG
jgi:hypothetical protein